MPTFPVCDICGRSLPDDPWVFAISRPDKKTFIFRICERDHVLIACDWIRDMVRRKRLDRK